MTESEAWLLLDWKDAETYCHSIAKCQQVVEKSINVIDAVLREQGIFSNRVKPKHYPINMINRLVRLPLLGRSDLAANMQRLFTRWGADIYDICDLAPELPPQGELYQRNTEYPFQNADGSWTAPSAPNSFTLEQVKRFMTTARNMRREAQELLTATRLNQF